MLPKKISISSRRFLAGTIGLILFFPTCSDNLRSQVTKSRSLKFPAEEFFITADLQIPDGPESHPAVVIVHGDGRGTRTYYRTMRDRFTSAGYATMIWDKPGFGDSTGKFSNGRLLSERAGILLEAISLLQKQPEIDARRIGVWGVSQAGYVVPMALQRNAPIAFMILVGAPGENGMQQTAYYIGSQVLCEGFPAEQAMEADTMAAAVMAAQTYQGYASNGRKLLDRYPIIREIGFMAGILPEERWSPRNQGGESFYDPMEAIRNSTIPALVFFGELDKNVDPIQGSAVYKNALKKAGNPHSRVVLFPGVDHDMIPCKTGCEKERNSRSSWRAHPGYLDVMVEWLKGLKSSKSILKAINDKTL